MRGVLVDHVPDRPADETVTEVEVIDVAGLNRAALAALPESALVAALRRAVDEYASGPDSTGRFTDGPQSG